MSIIFSLANNDFMYLKLSSSARLGTAKSQWKMKTQKKTRSDTPTSLSPFFLARQKCSQQSHRNNRFINIINIINIIIIVIINCFRLYLFYSFRRKSKYEFMILNNKWIKCVKIKYLLSHLFVTMVLLIIPTNKEIKKL